MTLIIKSASEVLVSFIMYHQFMDIIDDLAFLAELGMNF